MTHHVTRVSCSREEAEAAMLADEPFPGIDPAPVLAAAETAAGWELQLYTDGPPSEDLLTRLAKLAPGQPTIEALPDADWVTLSQAGLAPVDAGRFHVAPADRACPKAGQISLLIGAGLAFGTGQHATTRGCLIWIDRLRRRGRLGRVLDLGTGTGILAIAALRADPRAKVWASDIDPVAARVAGANARTNRARSVRLAVAAGLSRGQMRAGAPFDLVLANILAEPLVALAGPLAETLRPGGHLVLAGLLAPQQRRVEAAYRARGFRRVGRIGGEWPVLLLARRGHRRGGAAAAALRVSRRGTGAVLRSAGSV